MPNPEPAEVAGELWLAERQMPMRERAVDSILDYFLGDLPETARMATLAAVVDEVLDPEADEDPPEGVYTHYERQFKFLTDLGLVQVHEDEEWEEEDKEGTKTNIKVYSLTQQAFLIYRATRRKDGAYGE